ncbi:MAG: DNA translocase FtsK 4TM domain-containing protein [bacterium]|jgi:S-DNA-T family DNA segregation ATPase FtsK/SpoIIIE
MANKLRSQIPDSTSQPEPEEVKEQPKERISQKASKEASKEKKEAKAEKSESTNSKKLDARFIKISGLLLVLVSLYLFIAFFSYLFTWKEDQSVVSNASFNIIFDAANHKVENWLGIIGAMVSHLFMYRGFGLASFLFVLASFLIGYRLLFKVSLLKISRTLAYSTFFLVFVSITTAFIISFVQTDLYFLSGAYGIQMNYWLNNVIGKAGTAGLIAFSGLSVLVIAYNIEFKAPKINLKSDDKDALLDDELLPVELNRSPLSQTAQPTSDFEAKPKPFESRNKINVQEELVPVLKTEQEFEEEDSSDDFEVSADEDLENFQTAPSTEIEESIEDQLTESLETNIVSKEIDEDGFEKVDYNKQEIKTSVTAKEPDLEIEMASTEFAEEENVVLANTNSGEVTSEDLVKEFGEYDPTLDLSTYKYPPLDLLENYGSSTKISVNTEELERNKNKIVETLGHYSIEIAKIKATIGPTVTLYEIVPAAGVRISKIKNLEDDIALSLSALGIRIIAPIPGKGTIGIEVPNQTPEMVAMRSVLASEKYQHAQMDLPIALGKTISNEVFVADLAKMPHLLMAGATGQGKSVGINALLVSLLYKKHPSQIKFVMVDPKKVELTLFRKIERHFLAKLPGDGDAIITDTKKVVHTLNSLCIEMDQRYELLKDAHVRNLKEYNAKFIARKLNPQEGHRYMPFIVLVIDEFADLMMTAGKEIETPIARLAQLARAIGIHLVIATQRPSVNVITGTIKANFPARLAFRVSSKIDSRTILDAGGAEQLIGRGDMLLSLGSDLIRLQCAFVDTPEVEKVTDFIGAQRGYASAHLLPEYVDENGEGSSNKDMDLSERDALFEDAARLIVMHQQGSTSLIQRKLKLGYNRAGRIIDQLEAFGIVGPFEGSKAREVLIKDEYHLEQHLNELLGK